MKTLILSLLGLFASMLIVAQTSLPFKYQAVLRNQAGDVLINQNVALRFSILSGENQETIEYAEVYDLNTSEYGMVNLNIGEGYTVSGNYADVDWSQEFLWLAIDMDQNGGLNFVETGISRLLAVPFANYAAKANYNNLDNLPQLFDGDYNSLTNKPEIFTGDYNDLDNAPALFDGEWNSLNGKPEFSTVATSGNYNDLNNKPALFDGTWTSLTGKPAFATVATSGSYNDLTSTPNLSVYATKDMGGQSITNLASPAGSSDAATKAYVDALEQQLTDLREMLVSYGTLVRDFDGNIYNTVRIGTQVWMSENLRTKHYADGTPVAVYYSANNNSANDESYGLLYNWNTAMNGAASSTANPSGIVGICPTGWHMPSDAEWKQLETYLGMAADQLNLTMQWRGTNQGTQLKPGGSSGFNADFAGIRYNFDNFTLFNSDGQYWSSTESGTTAGLMRGVATTQTGVYRNGLLKTYYINVRCIKD